MAEYDLGKVSIRPRGAYAANTNYEFLDSVQNLGGSWLALVASKGIQPGVTSGWQNYWMMITKGIKSITGTSPAAGQTTLTITFTDGSTSAYTYENEAIAPGSITRTELAADVEILSFTNKSVAVSAWVANSTYADWGFRASIACTGVTTKHYAEVIFAPADATSGEFCPVNNTYDGGVYIYAANKPTATITIPLIVATPLS